MLDWLIVGGGVQGTLLSAFLNARRGGHRPRIAVLDRHAAPMAVWDARVRNVGMDFLRSPAVHHIDRDPSSLGRFAEGHSAARFRGRYARPSVELFDAHCAATIEKRNLLGLRVQAEVKGLIRCGDAEIGVETDRGLLKARRVLLALGRDGLAWPEWALPLLQGGAQVGHVLDPDFDRPAIRASRIAVIGGGITGAQTAIALAAQFGGAGHVVLVRRHEARLHEFDSDPGWLGPRFLDRFHREKSWARRREAIRKARNIGSMPSDIALALREAIGQGSVTLRSAEVTGARLDDDTAVALSFDDDGPPERFDRIVLATGFDRSRPGGAWLDHAVDDLELPCAPCGFPQIDKQLEWAPGIHAAGALAELEIGPTAPNIAGARMAAARLAAVD